MPKIENALRKSDWLDDWFVIDKPGAIPEGAKVEWLEIVKAAKAGQEAHFKRVAIQAHKGGWVSIWSPRNSTEGANDGVHIAPEELPGWIEEAERVLAEVSPEGALKTKLAALLEKWGEEARQFSMAAGHGGDDSWLQGQARSNRHCADELEEVLK